MTAIRIIDTHLELADIGSNTHAQIDSHISNTSNPHTVTKAQVGLGSTADGAEINVQSDWNAVAGDAFILNKPSDITDLSGHAVTELSDVTGAGSGIIISDAERTKLNGIETGATTDQTKADIDGLGLSHDSLVDVSVDDHHNELHSIASHNDTSATGAQLDTLTDNSIADTLHRHSELVASDGTPDPALSVSTVGCVGIGVAGASITQLLSLKADSARIKIDSVNGYPAFEFYHNNVRKWLIYNDGTNDSFHWKTNTQTWMTILQTGQVGLGITTPATSAKLELSSTTGALLLSRMTTAQKNALTAINGMLVYDSTLNKFQGYENGAWTSLI